MPVSSAQPTALNTTNVADLLERVLDKGVVIAGDVKIKLLDIELLTIQLRLVICSVDKARELGLDWWTNTPEMTGRDTSAALPAAEAKPASLPSAEEHAALLRLVEELQQQLEDMQSKPWRTPRTP